MAIILTDTGAGAGGEPSLLWEEVRDMDLMHILQSIQAKRLLIRHHDLQALWREFCAAFQVVEAAGGIVRNPSGNVLFIYRMDRWDLPKGKVEPGETPLETARREVGEECGLHDLEVGEFVATTYHIYEEKQKQVLKKSHWYEMYSRTVTPVPQEEEGISEAIWSDAKTTEKLLANTYPNIRLLLNP